VIHPLASSPAYRYAPRKYTSPPHHQPQPPAALPAYPQQSPIILEDPIYADFGDRKLEMHWASQLVGTAHKDDHGLQIDVSQQAAEHEIRLDRRNFQLQSFHFHSPSEHWLGGRPHDMELHMVHKNPEDGTLAVVGVLIDGNLSAGHEPDPICKFLKDVDAATHTGESLEFDPTMFMPPHPDQYYRYEGSLTTPPYASNVSWSVLREPLSVSQEELAELKHLFEKPAREPQPLHRRFVLASFQEEGNIARP
jgi:carbonic anhydrase